MLKFDETFLAFSELPQSEQDEWGKLAREAMEAMDLTMWTPRENTNEDRDEDRVTCPRWRFCTPQQVTDAVLALNRPTDKSALWYTIQHVWDANHELKKELSPRKYGWGNWWSEYIKQLNFVYWERSCTIISEHCNRTSLFQLCACCKDGTDQTPLEVQECEKILKAGADPNRADLEGNSPVSVLKSIQLAQLIFKYGGDGTKVQDAQCKTAYQEYRTRLNNENETLGLKDMPQLVRTLIQGLNGMHCKRCNKQITGDSRKDGDGQMCMECYGKQVHNAKRPKEVACKK